MRIVDRLPLAAALAALATLTAGCADPATSPAAERPSLIVSGTPTGSSYASVGALAYDFDGDGITGDDGLCTGSLVSATVFLTAAHCVEFLPANSQLYVSFAPDLYAHGAKYIAATGYEYHPQYNWTYDDAHDIAVVLLPASATKGMTPYKLPTLNYLDKLAAKGALASALFLNVGYGTSATLSGVPDYSWDGVRKYSYSEYMGLKPYFLGLLMQTNATGEGGDCYGDSGGPKFLASDPTTVVATVVTGDIPCRSTSWDYRVDTQSARDFLAEFVKLP